MNLHDLEPATLQSSVELDALIAEKWMGWKLLDRRQFGWGEGPPVFSTGEDPDDLKTSPTRQGFSPSTNPAHAGEARRKAVRYSLADNSDGVICTLWGNQFTRHKYRIAYMQRCLFRETSGDKAAAEALATCRAIVAALQAGEAKGGG